MCVLRDTSHSVALSVLTCCVLSPKVYKIKSMQIHLSTLELHIHWIPPKQHEFHRENFGRSAIVEHVLQFLHYQQGLSNSPTPSHPLLLRSSSTVVSATVALNFLPSQPGE